jgi:hypothetical protein
MLRILFRCGGDDVHAFAIALEVAERYNAVHKSKKSVIIAHAAIDAGMQTGAPLTHNDISCPDALTAVALYTQTL